MNLICTICERPIEEDPPGWAYGHNAQPVNAGRCCSDCNYMFVIPARVQQLRDGPTRYSERFKKRH